MEKEPFKPSPYLSDEINSNIAESELAGGCWWDKMPEGSKVKVQTQNTLYELKREGGKDYIKGNAKYCPDWSECIVQGSTWGSSMLKMGFIGRGMYLEVYLFDINNTILTTAIKEVEEVK